MLTLTMIDAPIYIDLLLACFMFAAAVVQCFWLAFNGHNLGRWMIAIGWCGLSVRITWSVFIGEDPPIAAVSVPLLMLASGGSAITAIRQIRFNRLGVTCQLDPDKPCYREDRIHDLLKKENTFFRHPFLLGFVVPTVIALVAWCAFELLVRTPQ